MSAEHDLRSTFLLLQAPQKGLKAAIEPGQLPAASGQLVLAGLVQAVVLQAEPAAPAAAEAAALALL
jgi:hypothetical protein